MKTKFKLLIIIFLLLFFTVSHVYAVDMFLTQDNFEEANNESSSIIEDETNDIEDVDSTSSVNKEDFLISPGVNTQTDTQTIGQSSPTVTTTSSVRDNSLTVSDIIDIILIAVCVVLIFLAIAILIRCK